jgi:hypothetical protein
VIETLLGGVFGGLFRLAPEVIKWFDAKNERAHKLAMLQAEMEFAKVKGEIQMRQTEATMSVAELQAMQEAFKEQSTTASNSYRWVSALSALVRPIVTYWFVIGYAAVKIAAYSIAVQQGGEWRTVLIEMWNKEDMALLNLLLTFWFVGRVFERTK